MGNPISRLLDEKSNVYDLNYFTMNSYATRFPRRMSRGKKIQRQKYYTMTLDTIYESEKHVTFEDCNIDVKIVLYRHPSMHQKIISNYF